MAEGDSEERGRDYRNKIMKGYEYNGEFMNEAFALFMQGISGAKIAERLQKSYPGLCRQTVEGIIKKFEWKDLRHKYLKFKAETSLDKERIIGNLKKMEAKLMAIIMGPEPNHQHFAQMIKIQEQLALYLGFDPRVGSDGLIMSTDREMNAYLEAIQEDEVLGPALKKRKAQIKTIYEQKLNGNPR